MSNVINGRDWYRNPPKYLFVTEKFCLTSPVSNWMPPQPQQDLRHQAHDLGLQDVHHLRFNLNTCPQIAFVPKLVRYVGPLLGRLGHYKVVLTPVGKWALEPSIMDSWKSLELTLTHAIGALSSNCVFHLLVGFFDYPARFGYAKEYVKVGTATARIKSSRQAFGLLLGLFSMFYSLRAERSLHYRLDPSASNVSRETPRDIIKSKTLLDDRTIENLEDMHAMLGPRIGVVIDGENNGWAAQLQLALAWAGVDHWYLWGNPLPREHELLGRWLPDGHTVRRLYEEKIRSGKNYAISPPPNPSTRPNPPCDDAFHSGSSTGVGTTTSPFASFFQKREEKREERKKKASPEELQRWESRKRNAEDLLVRNLDPKKKSKVFHWKETNGVRVRTPIIRGEWSLIWESDQNDRPRSHGQRRYCEIADEWDVCTEFDPEGIIGAVSAEELDRPHDDGDEEDFGPTFPPGGPYRYATHFDDPQPPHADDGAPPPHDDDPPPPHADDPPLPHADDPPLPHADDGAPPPHDDGDTANPLKIISGLPPAPPPLPLNYMEMGTEFAARQFVQETERVGPALDELLYMRYGFNVSAVASDLRLGLIGLPTNALTLNEVAAVLMEKHGGADEGSTKAVQYLITALQSEKTIAPAYWDLDLDTPDPLLRQSLGYFRFAKFGATQVGNPTKELTGYRVIPMDRRYQRSWILVLDSPIAVTHCIRGQWGPSLEDVVLNAVNEGYCMHVMQSCLAQPLPPRSGPPVLFGRRMRSEGFTPTKEDYTSYLSVVELLMQQPRLNVAVFRGGILARIVHKFVHTEDLLEGPSSDAGRYGVRWLGPNSECWVEDSISDEEIDLLIGSFYIGTGRGEQTAKKSFFPAPNVWEASGLNTRVWSNSAEERYQSIVRSVTQCNPSSNGRTIRSAAEWKSSMRHFKPKTERLLKMVEDKAKGVIERGD